MSAIARVHATLIVVGVLKFKEVSPIIRDQVKDILIALGLPELAELEPETPKEPEETKEEA